MRMRRSNCIICLSENHLGAISTQIKDTKFLLCGSCLEHIQSLNQNSVRDHIYDEFLTALHGVRSIVINVDYGGFDLSFGAKQEYLRRSQTEFTVETQGDRHSDSLYGLKVLVDGSEQWVYAIDRDNPLLVSVVRDFGEAANGRFSKLKIVQIPQDVDWVIEDYDGREYISERHRFWG